MEGEDGGWGEMVLEEEARGRIQTSHVISGLFIWFFNLRRDLSMFVGH